MLWNKLTIPLCMICLSLCLPQQVNGKISNGWIVSFFTCVQRSSCCIFSVFVKLWYNGHLILNICVSRPQQLSTYALTLYKYTTTINGRPVLVGESCCSACHSYRGLNLWSAILNMKYNTGFTCDQWWFVVTACWRMKLKKKKIILCSEHQETFIVSYSYQQKEL